MVFSRGEIIDIFNEQINSLFTIASNTHSLQQFTEYKNIVLIAIKTKKNCVFHIFKNVMEMDENIPKAIMNHDENFFMNLDFTRYEDVDESSLDIIQSILSVWKMKLEENIKKRIWKYFELMVRLVEKYSSLH